MAYVESDAAVIVELEAQVLGVSALQLLLVGTLEEDPSDTDRSGHVLPPEIRVALTPDSISGEDAGPGNRRRRVNRATLS